MNGFSTVEKLKELEQKDPSWQSQDGSVIADVDYLSALYQAAPLLLDIAGQIQPEDQVILGLFVEFMEKFNPSGHLNDEGPGKEITNQMAAECLRRYQKMAEKMNNWR